MTLNLDDLQLLQQLRLLIESGSAPSTMREVATRLGIQRTLLYRLRDRVNEQLEGDLEWIRDGQFTLPAEVFRLTRRLLAEDGELAGTGFPVVSAGSTAKLLLTEYILRRNMPAPRLRFRRSFDAVAALKSREIDMALLNRIDASTVDHDGEADSQPENPDLTEVPLRHWRACEASPFDRQTQPVRRVLWQPGGFAHRLDRVASGVFGQAEECGATSSTERSDGETGSPHIRLSGYDVALEMLRRGMPVATTIPSIYLVNQDVQRFQLLPTATPVTGRLVAFFRREDHQRFLSWLDQDAWDASGMAVEQLPFNSKEAK